MNLPNLNKCFKSVSVKNPLDSVYAPAAGTLSLLALLLLVPTAFGEDFAALIADRTAVERVYYIHRIGEKPPFEQSLPRQALERLVRDDLRKEATLKRVYRVEITPAMLDAEAERINATTRAPEVLAELKAALGNDQARFARTVARPIVVERTLRGRFDNDDPLHAPQRQQAERTREKLLAAKQEGAASESLLALLKSGHSNAVTETTWQLGARPAEKPGAENPDEAEVRKRFGANAQVLSTPRGSDKDRKVYFEDLPSELRNVLRAQLLRRGDISAVIETPSGFLVYLATEKTDAVLRVAALSAPKRSYEEWLEGQPSAEP